MLLVDALSEIAQQRNITTGQLALAWLLAQNPWIAPIPGTTKLHRLEENIGSTNVVLTIDELAKIKIIADGITLVGDRYPAAYQQQINR